MLSPLSAKETDSGFGRGVAGCPGRPTKLIRRSSGHRSGALTDQHQREAWQSSLDELERVVVVQLLHRFVDGQTFLGPARLAFLPPRAQATATLRKLRCQRQVSGLGTLRLGKDRPACFQALL